MIKYVASSFFKNSAAERNCVRDGSKHFVRKFSYLDRRPMAVKNDIDKSRRKFRSSALQKVHQDGLVRKSDFFFSMKKMECESLYDKREPTVMDYSWLPKAPSTQHIKLPDVHQHILFSGYRPLSITPEHIQRDLGQDRTFYEVSLDLQSAAQLCPWLQKAMAGQASQKDVECSSEWQDIPLDKLKAIIPASGVTVEKMWKTENQTKAKHPHKRHSRKLQINARKLRSLTKWKK